MEHYISKFVHVFNSSPFTVSLAYQEHRVEGIKYHPQWTVAQKVVMIVTGDFWLELSM